MVTSLSSFMIVTLFFFNCKFSTIMMCMAIEEGPVCLKNEYKKCYVLVTRMSIHSHEGQYLRSDMQNMVKKDIGLSLLERDI